jgi:hypothetical protein
MGPAYGPAGVDRGQPEAEAHGSADLIGREASVPLGGRRGETPREERNGSEGGKERFREAGGKNPKEVARLPPLTADGDRLSTVEWGWHTWMKPRTGHLTLLGAMEALRDRLAVP